MNIIHYTQNFREKIATDIKREIVFNKIQGLLNVDIPENLNSIQKFPKGILVVKLLKSQLSRIIIQPKVVHIPSKEPIQVYFVRDYFAGGNFDYLWGNVTFPQLKSGEWIENHPLSKEDENEFIQDYLKDDKFKKSAKREPVPKRLLDWIDGFNMTLQFDIYEREKWVSFSNDRSIHGLQDKYVILFKRLLKIILNGAHSFGTKIDIINESNKLFSIVDLEENLGIIYNDFPDIDGQRIIVLHDGAVIDKQKERWNQSLDISKAGDGILSEDITIISRDAFRAYPKWIVNADDEDMWESIQRYEGTHNFSLLPEQVNFLRKFHFPTYINGQAGSGKSTMLYYLFANVYLYKCLKEFDGEIIFLSENDTLLDHTVKSVIGLLTSNPEFSAGLTVEQKSEIRHNFYSFKKFLLETLPEGESKKFPPNKYLDFARFKDEYNLRRKKNKYSAEEVWFVISTYVYGYYEDKIIDTGEKYCDEIDGIPKRFRIISKEKFDSIISESLPFYDKLIENGWWDKTTLIRKIRSHFPKQLPKQFSVVICDEAQDFSRIELRLIIQSSIFTNYDLSDATEVPIVFAGDALQTVSPTGFSDRRLHQMYYDVFKEANFKYDKESSTYSPTYNYRSIEAVVRLANVVQNYRKVGLQEDVFIKQTAKRISQYGIPPILHDKEWLLRDEIRNDFRAKFKFKSFIVPVDLHEENQYKLHEELIEDFTDVKSSIDAKGAEYPQVVVYGFGDYYTKEFGKLQWQNEEYDFKTKFFFNKLYVALTRAQNELIIIDGNDAIRDFWNPLLSIPSEIAERWEEYTDFSEILLIRPESGLADILDSTPDEALHNARKDMNQGLLDKNPARLVIASNVFMMLGNTDEANLSLGYKEQLRGNWELAAQYFEKAGKIDLQAAALFSARAWSKLRSISVTRNGKEKEAQILISNLMEFGIWKRDELKKVYDLGSAIYDVMRNVIWYKDFSGKIIQFAEKASSSEIKRELTYIIESVKQENDHELIEMLGSLYFTTKQYSEAIKNWDELIYGDADWYMFPDYIRAKIEKAKDESNLIEELLWSGQIIFHDIPNSERTSISKKYIDQYRSSEIHFENSVFNSELKSHYYAALAILGEYSNLGTTGVEVESHYDSKNGLTEFYSNLILKCEDEVVSIYMKERWAKAKFNALKTNQNNASDEEIIEQLNTEFETQKFPFPDSNQIWSLSEILEISELPSTISAKPEGHIKNFLIENFRKFKKLDLKDLGQFNLVLGGNNSGKTSVLESLLFDQDPNKCLLNFVFANNQRIYNSPSKKTKMFFENIVNNQFKANGIQITIKNGRRLWNYTLRHPSVKELFTVNEIPELDNRHYLCIEGNNEIKISESVEILEKELTSPKTLSQVPLIPFGKGYSEMLASIYFSEIGDVRSLRISFLEQMKLFIPNITGITIDPSNDTIKIEEYNEVTKEETSLPLHHYGEGANKLFRILVQLHAAKGGRLMIDEIDAGIHYSHFKKFWEIILLTSMEYGVQIFATTHNEECVDYFWEVIKQDELEIPQDRARIVTLESHINSNEPVPIIRDFESIRYAQENHLEVRGRSS
ncbi:MAG: AAA family ATPase [bacterium]|nr:AAA family ATPase [bacterium]